MSALLAMRVLFKRVVSGFQLAQLPLQMGHLALVLMFQMIDGFSVFCLEVAHNLPGRLRELLVMDLALAFQLGLMMRIERLDGLLVIRLLLFDLLGVMLNLRLAVGESVVKGGGIALLLLTEGGQRFLVLLFQCLKSVDAFLANGA